LQTLETIVNAFPISNEEYAELEAKFGGLAHYAAWQLKKKNSKNSMTNDQEDDVQELRIALLRAGSYYKRQTYIEESFEALDKYVKDRQALGKVRSKGMSTSQGQAPVYRSLFHQILQANRLERPEITWKANHEGEIYKNWYGFFVRI
jgi:hypothetical protein